MYFRSNQSYRATYLTNSSLLGQNITPELILNQHLTELKKASMENRKCCGIFFSQYLFEPKVVKEIRSDKNISPYESTLIARKMIRLCDDYSGDVDTTQQEEENACEDEADINKQNRHQSSSQQYINELSGKEEVWTA